VTPAPAQHQLKEFAKVCKSLQSRRQKTKLPGPEAPWVTRQSAPRNRRYLVTREVTYGRSFVLACAPFFYKKILDNDHLHMGKPERNNG
jgi:hypothetical protein